MAAFEGGFGADFGTSFASGLAGAALALAWAGVFATGLLTEAGFFAALDGGGLLLAVDLLMRSPRAALYLHSEPFGAPSGLILKRADCSHDGSRDPRHTKHCSSPCNRMSFGRSIPMKTILLCFFSPGIHLGPRSLPISW